MFFKKNDFHFKKSDLWLIPNILTYVRIALVPVFIVVYTNAVSLEEHIWSAVLVALISATDIADGFIARHYNQGSDIGKIIDPIADKIFQFSLMICVYLRYPLVLLLIVIYAVKEVVSFLASSFLFTRGKHISGAMWAGKLCTVVLALVMIIFVAVPKISLSAADILIGFAAAFMLMAFFVYMRSYFKLWVELLNEQKEILKTNISPLDSVSSDQSDKNI